MKKNNLDERQEQKLLQIEHNGCWMAFWMLLASLFVQEMIFGIGEWKYVAGEWIVFMCLALYLCISCIKNGIWDRRLAPDGKTNFFASIVAAAVSALFAFQLHNNGFEGGEALVPLVFMLIIATVVVQSLTARPLAQLLGVAQPSAFGFLILGANPVARMIATELGNQEVPVVLADPNWENVRQARMENLQVYFGNPVSEHAANQLDLTGIGNLLVISPYKQMNSLATYHFLDWFGDHNSVYSLSEGEQDQLARYKPGEKVQRTRGLFDGVSFAKLASMVSQGFTVKTTQLSEAFTYADFLERHQGQALVLFVLDGKKHITPIKSMADLEPKEDSTLISLVPGKTAEERKEIKESKEAEKTNNGKALS